MKKLIVILVFIQCFTSIYGQHILKNNLNMLRPDDVIIKQQVSYKDPGRSGENVLWDFSKLNTENEEYKLQYSSRGDSVIVGTEHRTMYYYSLSNDSLLLWGYENPTTIMTNELPELLMKFPVNYKDQRETYYNGNGKYCDRLSISAMGIITSEADAYGMMILPNKDTLKNVIRVRTFKRIAEETKPLMFCHPVLDAGSPETTGVSSDSINFRMANDSLTLEVETFRWYSKGYRYPIFETVRSSVNRKSSESEQEYFNVAFFYPPQDHYYLEEDEANLAELQNDSVGVDNINPDNANPWKDLTYNIYPNPVIANLDIELLLPEPANIQIQLTDRQGRVMLKENWGPQPTGLLSRQIYMAPYVRGEYVLNIWLDGVGVSEKILKR